jgi:hypothetical protein
MRRSKGSPLPPYEPDTGSINHLPNATGFLRVYRGDQLPRQSLYPFYTGFGFGFGFGLSVHLPQRYWNSAGGIPANAVDPGCVIKIRGIHTARGPNRQAVNLAPAALLSLGISRQRVPRLIPTWGLRAVD